MSSGSVTRGSERVHVGDNVPTQFPTHLGRFGPLLRSTAADGQRLSNWLQRKDSHPAGVSLPLKIYGISQLLKHNPELLSLTLRTLFPGNSPDSCKVGSSFNVYQNGRLALAGALYNSATTSSRD